MNRSLYLVAAVALSSVSLALPAAAQDMTTMTFNGTTITLGGGFQFLSLPDIHFVGRGTPTDFRRQRNSDFGEYGGAAGGGIETALGYWGGYRVTGGIKGFWASVEDSERRGCNGSPFCVIADPSGIDPIAYGPSLLTKTDRDADYWGGAVELKFAGGEPVQVKPNLYRNDYFIIGADVRGIDQDNRLRGHDGGLDVFTYNETLDTTYTGGYIGFGGEYSLGFLGTGGFMDRLGLRSFVSARAGLYNADTDYDGRFTLDFAGLPQTRISQSNDELAFIASISLETRKQIGPRTSLSLWTDYEYISSVPKMRYADDSGRPTRIEDDDALLSRTMLRLNVGLGSSNLYPTAPPQ
ncbi:MAG TPA: hypothetical protein VEX16_04350 [Methyloceanibacter sp.]|nr:hypothetical protein [Methyloceanibacter sp.]